jgi:RNA polymerase subunit RPABC4/transcription elongation factor Spt4
MGEQPEAKEKKRSCPYCEEQILTTGFPYCQPCGVALRHCVRCQTSVERDAEVCPQCGGELEWN